MQTKSNVCVVLLEEDDLLRPSSTPPPNSEAGGEVTPSEPKNKYLLNQIKHVLILQQFS